MAFDRPGVSRKRQQEWIARDDLCLRAIGQTWVGHGPLGVGFDSNLGVLGHTRVPGLDHSCLGVDHLGGGFD